MTEEIRALVEHRLRQAAEALASAGADLSAGRNGSAVNRGYYAMFYAAMALLASRQIGTSKHSGLIAAFSEQFIKNGPLPIHLGRALNQAFDLRQKADYRELFAPTAEQAQQVLASADEFISAARRVLGVT